MAETKRLIVSQFVAGVLHLSSDNCSVHESWTPVGETSGFLGTLHRCQLVVVSGAEAESTSTHSFIAKFELIEDNPFHEFSVSNNLFSREVAFYEYSSGHGLKVPLYYFSSLSTSPSCSPSQRYLVMEDLTGKACTPSFEVGCSYEQCIAVIVELAKVHSLDVTALPPGSALMDHSGDQTLQGLYRDGIQGLLKFAEDGSPLVSRQWEILARQMPAAVEAAYEDMVRYSSSVGKPRLHITHGDLWSGNVLFSSVPGLGSQLVAIVDWQFAQLEHCTLFDLVTFLSSSTDTHIRQQYLTTFLDLYLDLRSDLCRENGDHNLLKQMLIKHFLTLGTAFAVASWQIFKVKGVKRDGQGALLLNRFWDLLLDYCNSL